MPKLRNGNNGVRTRALSIASPAFYQLSYRAPVYRCPNITKQNNEKIDNAISEVSKGDCIIMGDFNHGNIKWDSLQSTGVEDQRFLCLVQDNFLTQHVLEPTRAARVLYIVLSSHKEFVDNVVTQEPLGSSDHNQLHFNINIKSDKTKVKQCRRNFRKGKCVDPIDMIPVSMVTDALLL